MIMGWLKRHWEKENLQSFTWSHLYLNKKWRLYMFLYTKKKWTVWTRTNFPCSFTRDEDFQLHGLKKGERKEFIHSSHGSKGKQKKSKKKIIKNQIQSDKICHEECWEIFSLLSLYITFFFLFFLKKNLMKKKTFFFDARGWLKLVIALVACKHFWIFS